MAQQLEPELQEYYDQCFATMATPGWKYLVEDAQRMRDEYDRVQSILGNEHLWLRKGQLDILDWVINAKPRMEAAYRQLTESEE